MDPQALIEQARTLADGAAARAHGLVRRFVHRRRAAAAPLLACHAVTPVAAMLAR